MRKPSTFKILISEFNKLNINQEFNENELLDIINNNLPDENYKPITLKNVHIYLVKMTKACYVNRIDSVNFQKVKNLPNNTDYTSVDLDIESRVIKNN